MKYSDFNPHVLPANVSTQAKIARQLASTIAKDFHPDDWQAASKRVADNFTRQLQQEMMIELSRLRMKKA